MRFRDIHLFNEKLPSVYETKIATSNECSFFTLPFVDGYLWSDTSKIAGLRFKTIIDEKEILLEGSNPVITDSIPGKLHISWPLKTFEGTLIMDMDERQINIKIISGKSINWFLDLTSADNAKLPFLKVKPHQVDCKFEGMNYSIAAEQGIFSKPDEKIVFRITPINHSIILNFSGKE